MSRQLIVACSDAQRLYEQQLRLEHPLQPVTHRSPEDLMKNIKQLQSTYQSRRLPQCIGKAESLIDQVRAFSTIVVTFIQSDPSVAALVWGSACFMLHIAARHNEIMEHMNEVLEQVERALPRFRSYISDLCQHKNIALAGKRVGDAIVAYYVQLIEMSKDYFSFLRNSPFSQFVQLKPDGQPVS